MHFLVCSLHIAHVHLGWLYCTCTVTPINSSYRFGQCGSRSFFQLISEAYTGPSRRLHDPYWCHTRELGFAQSLSTLLSLLRNSIIFIKFSDSLW